MSQDILNPAFYLSLINRSCGLICVIDENGLFKYANDSLIQVTGYYPEELKGRLVLEFLHNNDIQPIKNALLLLKTYKQIDTPLFRIKTKAGNWKWIDAVIKNMLDDEHVAGYVIDARDVTLKKVAQEDIEKSQSFFNSFYKHHPHAIFILSPDGLVERVNSNVCRLLSYGKKELIGEHFSKFIASSFSFEAIKAIIRAENGEPSSLEGKLVNRLGKIVTLKFTIIPIFFEGKVISILGIAEDITAEKKALKELEKLSIIASKAVSCVMVTNAAGKIEWVNSEFTRVTGYTMREVLGRKPGNLLQGKDTDPKTVLEMHKMIDAQIPFSVEVINYRKNGEKFWFAMDIAPIFDDEGNISKFFAIQSDVTERKITEEKTRRLAEDLTRRNRELQQFNYIVSHNLRAPVANILGLVSILESPAADQKTTQKAIEKIKLTTLNLDNVIKDLDGILSLVDRTNGYKNEQVCIHKACTEVITSLLPTIEQLQANVNLTVPENLCVPGNKAYVYSIFHNLLSNSLKYSAQQRPPVINIAYQAETDTHLVIFQDNGAGIDLERYKDQVFKLYSKIDKQIEGRGLGLFMVKTQVEALGGSIQIESQLGKGTTFYIRFPKEQKVTSTAKATVPGNLY